ncbi:hypothetical protein LJ656_11035 [Paraburkholderia sp. MMS20-SJTR3]|uniref:Uncharacterized protein n=1 Tax=Paraburkholderia sejongensis TaxID=2886946 RepID=A0ABS8JT90_9BURK|nr:hypothetical protein [Paraburkholderia sp. MMS20-SJTR3]MCC8393125.1 hypothetical protein [Paraburkholderia sp. MMS20-SJTR3]
MRAISGWGQAGRTLGALGCATLLAGGVFPQTGFAQSEPVSAAAVQAALRQADVVHMQVRVVAIDPAHNNVTLRSPHGQLADVDVNPAIADISRLRVGDRLNVAYQQALLMHVDKLAARGVRERVETTVALPASGGSASSVHRVRVVATVVHIDRDKRLLTLRGPKHQQVLHAAREIPLADLRVGDSVRAEFVSAVAVALAKE